PLQSLKQRAVRGLPKVDATIIATTSQPCAVWTPSHTTESGRVRPNPTAGTRSHIPHLHPTQIAPTGQQMPIRTPRYSIEYSVDIVWIPKDLATFPRDRVPQPDSIVPSATRKQSPIGTPHYPKQIPAMA